MITYDDFSKIEIKVGKILSVEKVLETDKLLKLSVDFGDLCIKNEEGNDVISRDVRQIVSGIALYYEDFSVLVGKKAMFVTNLEPRTIKGLESNGMLFALSTNDGKFSLLEPNDDIPEGTRAK